MLAQHKSFSEWFRDRTLPEPLQALFLAAHASKSTKVLGFGVRELGFADLVLDRLNVGGSDEALGMLLRYRPAVLAA